MKLSSKMEVCTYWDSTNCYECLGPLEGQETLLNCVGKQKIEKTDVVLSSSCLNLIICFLTSSIYLMKSVIIVYFTEIHTHASNFLNTVFSLYNIETCLD